MQNINPTNKRNRRSLFYLSVLGFPPLIGGCTAIASILLLSQFPAFGNQTLLVMICLAIFAGPAVVGGLVAVYAVLKLRRRAVPLLAAYISLALIVTYVTWPALWGDPLRAFSASFQMASDFDWQGKVLFAGIEYSSGNLPASYLPTLIAIQLGETTLLLFLLGLAVAVWRFYQERSERAWFVMLSAWFFLPLLGVQQLKSFCPLVNCQYDIIV